jgi:putative transposase
MRCGPRCVKRLPDRQFQIDAWVVLPEEMHCLWTLPENDADPVKHRFVERAADWPSSSFRRCVAYGLYAADWLGGGEPDEVGEAR